MREKGRGELGTSPWPSRRRGGLGGGGGGDDDEERRGQGCSGLGFPFFPPRLLSSSSLVAEEKAGP